MQDFYLAVVIACVCAIGWGVSYFLKSYTTPTFQPATLSILYGALLVIGNCVYVACRNEWSDFYKLSTTPTLVVVFLGIHLAIDVILNFVFLYGYNLVATTYAGTYNAISSIYPVIIFILAATIRQQTSYRFELALPGLFFCTVGVILLSLSK
jgi:hypothetical protein